MVFLFSYVQGKHTQVWSWKGFQSRRKGHGCVEQQQKISSTNYKDFGRRLVKYYMT